MPKQLSSRRKFVAVLLALTLLSGIVHGYLDGRWASLKDKAAIGKKMVELPESLGEWSLVEAGELDSGARDMLRCYGSFMNVYRHEPSGALVHIAVMYGPRGPIAVHTPEICYSSQGTTPTRDRMIETVEAGERKHQFWSVEFAKEDDPADKFEVWYAWSTGQEWIAAENPRFWMTDDLFKIQLSGPATDSSLSPCKSLLTAFLPQLEQQIQ